MYNDYKVLYRFVEEKMKIKRLIALAFALVMVLCLVSCGGGKNPPANDGNLEFVSNGDGTCYVSGIGELAAAENIVIPEKSPEGDKVTGILTTDYVCNIDNLPLRLEKHAAAIEAADTVLVL